MSKVVNDNFDVQAGKPIDRRYHKPGTTDPYASTAEANGLIPMSLRYPGLTVLIGDNDEYWWKEGIADGNLIQKLVEGEVGEEVYDYIDAGDAASRAYADGLVNKVIRFQGNYNPSITTAFPVPADTNPVVAQIKSGFMWQIGGLGSGVSSTIGGYTVSDGDTITAIVDTPGQVTANWAAQERNLDFTPENPANKDTINGYIGLSAWKIKFRNLADTFTSFLQNAATAARTYIFPDKDITVAGLDDVTAVSPIGVQDLVIPGSAFSPRVSNPCLPVQQFEAPTSLFNFRGVVFPAGSNTYAQFHMRIPRTWGRGQVKATIHWTAIAGSAGVGNVIFEAKAGSYGDDDSLSNTLGSAVTTTDAFIVAYDLHEAPETAFFTVSNSPQIGDEVVFQLARLGASDTFAQSVVVLSVNIALITDAARV